MSARNDELTVFFCLDEINSTFEVQELNNCTNHFGKVVLLTRESKHLALRGPKLEVYVFRDEAYQSATYFFRSFKYCALFLLEFFGSIHYLFNFRIFIKRISFFLRANYLSDQILRCVQQHSSSNSNIVLYSFWFNQWATALAILKDRNPDFFAITRAHGTDLFEERVPKIKRIAFRSFELKHIDRIFSVSAAGSGYLEKKYPTQANKVFTSRLGTRDSGINPFVERGVFTLVSCAKIRNIKRIHLIAEILLHIDFPIKWIHIGGESKNDPTLPHLKRGVEQLIQKKDNVEIVFLGDLSEEGVIKTYLSESVNLFISVSETEGLPVSMMEAISFGIPVMATDVGGCNEIVNAQTGILIDKNFDAKNVAEEITRFKNSDRNDGAFRLGVRGFWENNFNTARNFDHFMSLVKTA